MNQGWKLFWFLFACGLWLVAISAGLFFGLEWVKALTAMNAATILMLVLRD